MQPVPSEHLLWLPPGGRQAGQASQVSIKEIRNMPMLLPTRPNGLRERVEAALARIGAVPRILAEIDALPSICTATVEELGDTVVPWSAIRIPGQATRLEGCRFLDAPELQRQLALCDPGDAALTPAVAAVRALLVQVAADLVTTGDWREVELA
jgi:LysR family tcuABC transcriptional regulator